MARIKIELPQKSIAELSIPVRITDINYGNHLGNDSLVSILHEARVQFLQLYHFTEMDAAGTSLIMSDLAVEYKAEAFYNDVIKIKIFAGAISNVGFELYYSLSVTRNNTTIHIAYAKTGMVCYNYSIKKVTTIPRELVEILS